jgi:chemotaxis protein CheD
MDDFTNYGRLNLNPGEWYVGAKYSCIYTVLGSCVSLTAWHPILKFGGMCHCVLPSPSDGGRGKKASAGHYASTVLELMKNALMVHAPMNSYELGVFGGSNILSHFNVGKRNCDYVQDWLKQEHLMPKFIDIGGKASRSITLTLNSGVVVKHHNLPTAKVAKLGIGPMRS